MDQIKLGGILVLLSQIKILNVIPTEGRNLLVPYTMRNKNFCLIYRFLLTSFVEMTGYFFSPPLAGLKEVTGHSNLSNLGIYTHPTLKRIQDNLEKMKINRNR